MRTVITKPNAAALLLLMSLTTSPLFAACTWNTTPAAVAFGTYSVFSISPTTSNSSFRFTCDALTTSTVSFTRGGGAAFSPYRTMGGPAPGASYNLYLNAGGSQIWGDGTGGSLTYNTNNVSTTNTATYTGFVYGIMPINLDLAPGSYSDRVNVSIAWTTAPCNGNCQGNNNGNGTSGTVAPRVVGISANVQPECRVDTFALSFGTYSPLAAAPLTASSALKVYCTRTTSITTVTLNSATWKMRSLATPDLLTYGATITMPGSLSSVSSATPIGGAGGFPINGSTAASQDVAVGAYVDTLQATINY